MFDISVQYFDTSSKVILLKLAAIIVAFDCIHYDSDVTIGHDASKLDLQLASSLLTPRQAPVAPVV